MEWSGWLQVLILLHSVPWGMGIGLLFDLNCGIIRFSNRRVTAFLLDAIFGLLAAMITFFCALVVMDGLLHPFLFGGILVGFLIEHYTLGRVLSWCVVRFFDLLSQASNRSSALVHRIWGASQANIKKIRDKYVKKSGNQEKIS